MHGADDYYDDEHNAGAYDHYDNHYDHDDHDDDHYNDGCSHDDYDDYHGGSTPMRNMPVYLECGDRDMESDDQ